MNEERKKVLEMLAEGKISANEAERLLEALESKATETSPQTALTETGKGRLVGHGRDTIGAGLQIFPVDLSDQFRGLEEHPRRPQVVVEVAPSGFESRGETAVEHHGSAFQERGEGIFFHGSRAPPPGRSRAWICPAF